MDDSRSVFLSLDANNQVEGYFREFTPALMIRCRENSTDVYVITGMPANPELGEYNRYTVRIRLDTGAPFRQMWGASTDDESLFAPEPIALARRIASSSKMLFEFTPFSSSPATVEFDLAGIDQVIEQVADACNWSLHPASSSPRASPESSASGEAPQGFMEPPAGTVWIGDPANRVARRIDCRFGQELLSLARRTKLSVPSFPSEQEALQAGYSPSTASCPGGQ